MIAKLCRMQFGRSSEQLDAMTDQLQLGLEELQVSQTELTPPIEPPPRAASHCPYTCLAKLTSISLNHNVLVAVENFAR
ncbi:hypothetical protein AFK24_25690 [Pseudomonas syringae]|uniref:Transposase TnpC homeodomain domain-containing protein n=1 Tax=Pseudomonas syringae TaxID=317 RepID=A0A1C7Z0A0_PSESX|nr:hypothetical protein AFK24_25690 [Pseudomonas syringae]